MTKKDDSYQKKHDYAATGKGPMLKIGNDFELVKEIERLMIDEKMSPYAAASIINTSNKFSISISYKTLMRELK